MAGKSGTSVPEFAALATRIVDSAAAIALDGRAQGESPVRILSRLSRFAETHLDAWRRAGHPPSDIDCGPGCQTCCHQPAIRIAVTEGRAAIDAAIAVFGARTLAARIDRAPSACPLLEDGLCAIHDHRPLVCRSMTARSRTRCQAMIRGEIGGVEGDLDAAALYLAAQAGLALVDADENDGHDSPSGFAELRSELRRWANARRS